MDLFDKALCYAIEKHSGQKRKFTNTPYILHPIEVAEIVGTITDDVEILSAAVLHDTVEDTDATIDEIKSLFGERVAMLVSTETEDSHDNLSRSDSWQIRKEESLKVLKSSEDISVKILWIGDKLSNMRSFYRSYISLGDKMWDRLNQKDPSKHAWYYREILKCLKDLEEFEAYKEFERLFGMVFGEHKEN